MLQEGIGMAYLKPEECFAAGCNLYGRGRVLDMLDKGIDLKALQKLDVHTLVNEALAGPAPIGVELG